MKILCITIQNLNSLRLKRTIDFTGSPLADTGLFAITGDTGAGKTTILDAMTLALYGRVHRNKDVKEVLSFGATECLAEVEFETRGARYRAKWSLWRARKKSDGNILGPSRELAKWNAKKKAFAIIAEKIREVDEKVEEVTGLDYDRFCRSVLLSQGDFAAFLKADERDRSDLLERMTGTEIYTRISIAAYERYKLEGKKLESLQQALAGLRLMDQEQLTEWQLSLEKAQAESRQQAKAIDIKRKQVQWRQRLEALQQKQSGLEAALEGLQQQESTLQPEFTMLSRSTKAQVFRSEIDRLDDLETQRTQLLEQIGTLTRKTREVDANVATASQSFSEKELIVAALRKEWQEKQTLFDQVSELDVEIRKEAERLTKEKADLEVATAEMQQLNQNRQALQNRLLSLEQDNEALKAWLHQNRKVATLAEDLPAIHFNREALRNDFQAQRQLEQEKEALALEQEKRQKGLHAAEQEIADQKKARNELLQQFKKVAPENYTAERSEVLHVLHRDIEALTDRKKNLQQIFNLNEEYQRLLSELSGYEEALENLQREELNVNKDLMSSLEMLDPLIRTLEYKQEIYNQQQLIANYDKDRSELAEGEPCPLCLSVHHPFRERSVKTYVNQARQELETVKKQHDLIYQRHRALLDRQQEIGLQIEQLMGNELKRASGQVANQFKKILEYEDRIARLTPDLAGDGFQLTRSGLLKLKLEESESQILTKRAARDQLSELNRALESIEKVISNREVRYQELQSEQRVLAERITTNRLQLADLEKKFKTTLTDLNKILKKYGVTFDLETAGEMFATLQNQSHTYHNKEKALDETAKAIQLTTQELQQIVERQKDLEKKHLDLSRNFHTLSKQLEILQNKRKDSFGDLDPRIEKKALEEKRDGESLLLEQLSSQLAELKTERESTAKLLREKEKDEKQTAEKIDRQRKKLTDQISSAGFANLAEVKAALLPEEEHQRLTTLQKEMEKQSLETRQSLRDLHLELETEQKKNLTALPLENLEEVLQTATLAFQQLQQSIGALSEKLEENERKKKESKALFKEIEGQQREYRRWSLLNDVIGQADGKKFRTFAQGLTLRRLTHLANHHLERLNGRYVIYKRSDADLELDIVDTYQADNRRSMHTLSGGESFLVSLALALGLSDLAGRDTQIRSLFIDEGFGTLDDNSLDLAITTLENLQAAGKTIGVISHVKALKERISTQIRIRKQGSGFSEIEVIA